MYVERNVFHLKFGASRQALQLWREYLQKSQLADNDVKIRLLTDITGRGYTIVLELGYTEYHQLEPAECILTKQAGWKEFYQKFIPLCDFAERTQFKIEAEY